MAYEFGQFRVDPQREELWRGDRPIPLNRKAVQLLVALIERQGELVTKEELLATVWPRGATMNNVSQHVFMLRQALEDSAEEHRYVLTVPRVGYRFVSPVARSEAESPGSILARHYCDNASALRQVRTQSSIESAIALYERALEQDVKCAQAYAGLGVCRLLLAQYMFAPQLETLEQAERDAQRALELHPREPWALVTLATVAAQLRYEWIQAEHFLLEALRAQPHFLWAHIALVETYSMSARLADARQALAEAHSFASGDEAFPRLPLLRAALHYYSGEYVVAAGELEALVAEQPTYSLARFTLAKVLLATGDAAGAQDQIDAIAQHCEDPLRPGQPNVRARAMALETLVRRAAGDSEGLRRAVAALETLAQSTPVSGFCLAVSALAQDDPQRAMREILAAIEKRDPLTTLSAVEPLLAPLHGMPGWPSVISALNLPVS